MGLRIPNKDDAFLIANAGRMFELLSGVDHHPLGYPINAELQKAIQELFSDAYNDGIDTIAVSEGGLAMNDQVDSDAYLQGVRDGLRFAVDELKMSSQMIRLNAGEISTQEMRTVQAVLGWKISVLKEMATLDVIDLRLRLTLANPAGFCPATTK